MRVEAYNQVAQLYNREKTQKVQNFFYCLLVQFFFLLVPSAPY